VLGNEENVLPGAVDLESAAQWFQGYGERGVLVT